MDGMKVKRRVRKRRPWLKWALPVILLAALIAILLALRTVEEKPKAIPVLPVEDPSVVLARHTPEEIRTIEVKLRGGERWHVTQTPEGELVTGGGVTVSERMTDRLLTDLSVIGCTRVLAEKEWSAAEFGLDVPKARVKATYADGTSVTMNIGNSSGEQDVEAYYYMSVDGDSRLMALDAGTAADLIVEEALLRTVVQPVIHKARIDRITVALDDGSVMAWALNGEIGDSDAQDRWFLEAPARYPADGERVAALRENAANLRLGAYVCEATQEALTTYGFDAPRMVLTIHQASGSIGAVGAAGEYTVTDWPESELVWTVGGAKSDVVDYVCYDGAIYLTSHYSVNIFMAVNASDTLTRYPVLTSLSNLAALTVETPGHADRYVVTRTEQVAENNALVYDENGSVVVDVAVSRSGEPIPWPVFEAAYNNLLMTTVSGTLPKDWTPKEEPHTRFNFDTVTGTQHTIALMDFDALHDAVAVDGCAMFYLIKDGLTFAPMAK